MLWLSRLPPMSRGLFPHRRSLTRALSANSPGRDAVARSKREAEAEEAANADRKPQLAPLVPPGALEVELPAAGSSEARFQKGWLSSLLCALRSRHGAVDVNYDFRSWAIHNGPLRNMKEWAPQNILDSPDIRRTLFPDVLFVGFTASMLTFYNDFIAHGVLKTLDTDGDGEVSMEELRAGIEAGLVDAHQVMGTDFFTAPGMIFLQDAQPFNLTAMALGMMLTFRTQNCNARYTEARGLWGAMNNESRAVCTRILALAGAESQQHRSDAAMAATHAVKLVMTFPRTLKYHITVDGFCPDLHIEREMSDADINAAKTAALRKELASIWDYDDALECAYVDRLLSDAVTPNRPLHVLQELTELTSKVLSKPRADGGLGLDAVHANEIYRSITRFHDVLGACERILRTPVYSGYTKFAGRCVWLWTNLLPLALYPKLGPMGTVPTAMVVALFLYGLEDIGTRIEQPFDSLPLWQYCDGIEGGCKQLLAQHALLRDVPRGYE